MLILALSSADAFAISIAVVIAIGSTAGIMLGIAHVSGWRSIARRYPAHPPSPDADRGLGSIEFAPLCGYNNCILGRSDDDYLHLRVMFPFNIFHSPISIPWVEVSELKPFWGRVRVVTPIRTWTISKRMARRELQNRELLAAGMGPAQS